MALVRVSLQLRLFTATLAGKKLTANKSQKRTTTTTFKLIERDAHIEILNLFSVQGSGDNTRFTNPVVTQKEVSFLLREYLVFANKSNFKHFINYLLVHS